MNLLPILLTATAFQSIDLVEHPVLTASSSVKPGVYSLGNSDDDGKTAALTIRGNNLVVDFKGAILQGTPQSTEPDQRKGTGILVQGKNVTIKNLKVRGYKIGLIARSCPGLRIIDSDFSYNWKQRLLSTLEREDGADWMSYHHNEAGEWLRYGAGIYLDKCDAFEVRGCKAQGGQCGLMLVNSNKGLAWNNDFSFLSGIGVGLYRSSENRIMHNKIDWCVRGFSYGVYNRGQDSAGILIFEQCNKNIFAYNSATHGGDGFFLWAGQTTMDTGKGGCNDNVLWGNDFSHSPANGIEATFSRNIFANNLMLECWHGIWGGYSYETPIVGNVFSRNAESIAIEHGQDISVIGNNFVRENLGINIWSNDAAPDPNWGYPKHRDTKSRDTVVERNLFTDIVTDAIRIRGTSQFVIADNTFLNNFAVITLGPKVENVGANGNRIIGIGKGAEVPSGVSTSPSKPNSISGGKSPKAPQSALNQGVDKDYAAFAVPLGATIKMDGCGAIYPALAAVFISQYAGIELSLSQYLIIALASVLGSFGTAGVPGTAVIMATVVISAAGLPLEAIGILYAIDRILDMMRTMTNVTGQVLVPVLVAKETGLLDREIYERASSNVGMEFPDERQGSGD